jgi:hypothetical protein
MHERKTRLGELACNALFGADSVGHQFFGCCLQCQIGQAYGQNSLHNQTKFGVETREPARHKANRQHRASGD